jgi:hypothetical protein
MKDKLLLDARRLFRFVAPAMAVLATGGCVTSLPSPPGITQVGPYEVRFGSMVPAPVAEIAEDPVGTLGKKANGMADSMFTQPIDDPFIFSVQANSWLQAFAGPNKVSGEHSGCNVEDTSFIRNGRRCDHEGCGRRFEDTWNQKRSLAVAYGPTGCSVCFL